MHNFPIYRNKFKQFDEILKACNGRYIDPRPHDCVDEYGDIRASFSFEESADATDFNNRWRTVTTDIIEKKRLRLKDKIKNYFKSIISFAS
jgi:hypothetical protein